MPITSENIAVVYDHVENDAQTLTTSSSVTKASSTQEILRDIDELESMLSLTQTLSFDEDNDEQDNNDNKSSAEDTYTTDDSYSVNSLESRSRNDKSKRISRREKALLTCGEGIEDVSDRFFDSIVDTGRFISSILKRGSSAKKNKYVVNKFFMSSEEQKEAKKEAIKRLEDERRERELKASRDEVGNVASLWRENRRFLA